MSSPTRRGPGRPRKLPADEQRALVLAAARGAFAAHGAQAATIEQIARDAGVSRQAVYEQFGDKNTLFNEVVADLEERAFAAIGSVAAGDAELELRAWARKNYAAMFTFVAEHPDALSVLGEAERLGDPAMTRLRARLARVYTEASRRRWAEFGVEPGRADTALVTMYFAMTEALVNLTWDGDPPDREALIDLLTEFTIGGVVRLYEQASDVIARMR
ncbi:TetR/AcrR family transcriptional regulator [Amycolatopsis anabasis]|uniref:TetR/AcrR family transcriptional regulator n=1 Tax=Amycolatopsis anabasis TaxID=1840409 RepID=UPI00131AA322|nr:TetR/AcrR family transcriptional regulator [Amycolatopsis anabasis]